MACGACIRMACAGGFPCRVHCAPRHVAPRPSDARLCLVCAWVFSVKFVSGGCQICEWPRTRPLRMTNTLGYLEFAAQGRTKESMLAALDLDLLYTISFHGRTILTRDSKEWDGLQLRQGIWRSIPLGMVQLPGPRQCLDSWVDCMYT